jgi:hypothetical protein
VPVIVMLFKVLIEIGGKRVPASLYVNMDADVKCI